MRKQYALWLLHILLEDALFKIENVTKMSFESHPKEGTTTQFPHVFDTESEGGGQGSQVNLNLLLQILTIDII